MTQPKSRKKVWRIRLATFGATFAIALAYTFLYGPLFAWSAIKPGYDQRSFQRSSVFYPTKAGPSPAYEQMDSWMDHTESFVQLKFQRHVSVIVCGTWSDCHRFMPLVRGESLGAMTPEFGTVIYITPKLEEMGFDPGEYVRHELTHAVILQNSPWKSRFRFKRTPWLFEGLPVLAADQKSYGTESDFIARARYEDLWPLFEASALSNARSDMRFAYRAWRYFLQWLIATQGRPRLQQLLTTCMEHPDSVEANFRQVYGKELKSAVEEFQLHLQ